jgi:hypothetical protein
VRRCSKPMLRIELGLTILLFLIAVLRSRLCLRLFKTVEDICSKVARDRIAAVVLVGVLALAIRAAILPIQPIPEPVVHDEFGYLLAADTYTEGRLTNPPHPLWQHFETFSIIQKPTYQCFAQPAQGMLLAMGKLLFGHPFWGVWLGTGLMCAFITWMLQGWMPEQWAFLGGVIAIFRLGTFSYWANSYWGGAAGALGGALVIGSWPRIRASQRLRDVLLMATGLAILANSRPYEGLVFSLPVAAAMFIWIFNKKAPPLTVSMCHIVVPICIVLLLAGLGMCYYFWRVTGSPLRMPYQVERETYAVSPYLLWQHERPVPAYRHLEFQRMYAEDDVRNFQLARSAKGVFLFATLKAVRIWSFLIGPTLSWPILMMFFVLPFGFSWKQMKPDTRFLMIEFGIFFVGLLGESYFEPHYAAPITCVLLALVLLTMQKLQKWIPNGRIVGPAMNRAIVSVCLLTFIVRAVAAERGWNLAISQSPAWHQRGPKSFGRAALVDKLNTLPGKQLVIVHYTPKHDIFDEWVYNDPDIDSSKIVWARDMGHGEDAKLIDYFKDRQVWTLQADENPPRLVSGIER